MNEINPKRVRTIINGTETNGPVLYWMSRDQRVHENWAMFFSQQVAFEKKRSLAVVFNLVPDFLEATIRQYGFMLNGLQELESELGKYNIPFFLLQGKPEIEIPKFINDIRASMLISDFDPLKIKRNWKQDVAKKINIPFYEVDAHNIVPCNYVSGKIEFGAYTIRPKIHKLLPVFLDEFPRVKKMQKAESLSNERINWTKVLSSLKVNRDIKEADWIKSGESAAVKMLMNFLDSGFDNYPTNRNDPNKNVLSNLSPYLHFGQISSQQIALEIKKKFLDHPSAESFLEELIVRKELSDNFCYYNQDYDSFSGFPDWAKKTLNDHRKDEREFIYSKVEFEKAETHEDLWNAAQMEMVTTGKMHGYMRMYWAKKILEWSSSPENALKTAIYLNDKYELDGRDPNGYAGCAWAIGGLHDRAWSERPVFGKIRYMNESGARRKFDVDAYIQRNLKVK